MRFKKKKMHLKNIRKGIEWGSPRYYQSKKEEDTFEQHDLSIANENTTE